MRISRCSIQITQTTMTNVQAPQPWSCSLGSCMSLCANRYGKSCQSSPNDLASSSAQKLVPQGSEFSLSSGPKCCAGEQLMRPRAEFASLPTGVVLTLNMDPPEPWLVEPVEAAADLDNLRLGDLQGDALHAGFELEALMLTGSCTATSAGKRGQVGPHADRALQPQ